MIESNSVLVIDDDPSACEVVADTLESNGFQPFIANNAADGLKVLGRNNIDLIIVDLGLPDMDGLELTRSLKSLSKAGVIILSGRTETTEKVVGLELGADDYLTKPFEPRELVARVRSVLRRSTSKSEITGEQGRIYEFDGWKLDINRRELTDPDNNVIEITSGEFDFLKVFVEHPNRVLSRDQILEFAYNNDTPAYDRSVDIRITRLRRKIEPDPKSPQWIKTLRNAGYIFAVPVVNVSR